MKQIATYGPIFIVLTHRSSNQSQQTLRAYPYKHHTRSIANGKTEIVFDLSKNNSLIEDYDNPVAKIDWQNGSVKILDKNIWDHLPDYVRDCITEDFQEFWQKHHS